MVKRKRMTGQSSQDEKTTESVSRDEAKRPACEPITSGVQPSIDAVNNSVMCGTRSRTLSVTARANVSESTVTCGETMAGEVVLSQPPLQRTSARVSKRVQSLAEASSATTLNNTQANKKNVGGKRGKVKPTRRSWELWSTEDKDAFFEGLCEYGKDFENIQSYIAQRSKKKGVHPNMIKNKDQVRHFYYRTWHKIVKYIDSYLFEEVKKHILELYALINYAELRKKKMGCLNDKTQQKLNELMFHGVTTVKFKGKKLRLKTPVCRTLKKINNLDSKEPEVSKLPKEILVEFRPRNNTAFIHVQNSAQNPNCRTKANLQRRLSTVVTHLESKWKPPRLKQKESILNLLPERDKTEMAPILKLYLKQACDFNMFHISSLDTVCYTDISLETYMRLSALRCDPKDPKGKKMSKSKATKSQIAAKVNNEEADVTEPKCAGAFHSVTEKAEEDNNDPEAEAERSVNLLKNMLQSLDDEPKTTTQQAEAQKLPCDNTPSPTSPLKIDIKEDVVKRPPIDIYLANQVENKNLTLGQFLSLNNADTKDKSDGEGLAGALSPDLAPSEDNIEERRLREAESEKVREMLEKMRNGWTKEDFSTLTFGELYLMLAHPESIEFEYEFVFPANPESPEPNPTSTLTTDNNHSKHRLQCLTGVLSKIVDMASNYFTDFKTKNTTTSPTCRNSSRSNNTTPTSKTGSGRGSNRSPSVRPNPRGVAACKASQPANPTNPTVNPCTNSIGSPAGPGMQLPVAEGSLAAISTAGVAAEKSAASGSNKEGEKHTFAMPLKTAPRPIKIAPNIPSDSVREQLEILAKNNRNNRQRNNKCRPLVVPRPLLPLGDGRSSTMTVVHLVASNSPVTTVIPKPMTAPIRRIATRILPSIPLMATPPNPVFQSTNVSLPKLISMPTIVGGAATTVNVIVSEPALGNGRTQQRIGNLCITTSKGNKSPPQISIPENSSESANSNVEGSSSNASFSTLLDISLEAMPNSNHTNPDHILDFNSNSSLSAVFGLQPTSKRIVSKSHLTLNDSLVTSRQSTPPNSPGGPNIGQPGNRFVANSPGGETNWLNGESCDFSLSSLLNTLESPVKSLPHPPSTVDNSTLDNISRLGPDVDTHLQCLINENSVDYVAKFADLAAQIASTSAENKCT